MDHLVVRDARPEDVDAITALKNAWLATTAIEWTDTPHTPAEVAAWLDEQGRLGNPVLVAEVAGAFAGWTSYGEFRDVTKWPGYRFTVEHTIHVDERYWGSGVGGQLITELADRARAAGMHAVVAGVDGQNTESIRFHERLGFVEAARLPEVGAKLGRWLDLVLLVLRLDDRPVPPEAGA